MRKLLVKVLTLILAFTSLFALSLFTGCDCGDNGGSGNVIPKPEDKVERYLNLDVSELNLIVGDEHKFTASYIKEEGKTLTFESADANVATVGAKGELLAYNEGSTTITAKYGDLTATCNVNVSFGNYLPELVFTSGNLDVYNLGLDGIPYTFSPVIKFNGKTFTDAEVTFVSANDAIAKFDNADVKGISLGETTATVTASWRGFTINEVPALQKVVKIKTHNVVNFLINDQTYDVMKLSTFNGEFEGATYSNASDFDVKIIYNGQAIDGNAVVNVADPSKVNVSNGKITAKGMGKTDVTLSYTDSNNQVFNTVITVEVIRPVADSGMKFNLFSNAHGYYKDVFADLQNKSVIKDVLGDDASKVTDAYVVDGVQLKVEGDKLLNLPVNKDASLLNKVVIGTATYAYACEIDTYGALVADKEDLAVFDVHFTNADETEYSFVEGYCELLRDIDATGFKPKHTAVHTVNPKVDMYNSYGNYYVGFRGTFNGKGFTIFNLDTTRDPITYINKNGNKQVDSQSVGLFGYIAGPATIKNVAFENMKVVNGSGITYRGLCSVVETTTTPKGNCTFENIYISLSEDSKEPKGILFFNVPGSRFNLRNVVINAPNLDVGDETSGGLIDNNGTGLEKDDRATYDGVVVISKYPLGFFSYYTMYGGNEKMGRDMYSEEKDYTVDLSKYALDTKLGYTPGPNGEKLLYRRKSAIKKYNNIAEMAQDVNNFSKFPEAFWKVEKDENGGQTIFWKSLLGYSYDLYNEDGEIFDSVLFDTEGAKPYKFTIKNSIEPITNYSATVSDSNVLEVKNGAIYLKQYKIGYYEVTLTFTSKFNTPITRVIPVTVDAKHIATYLQQDGEVVNHGLTELPAGASFSINGVNVAHSFEDGKLKVDLSGVDLSEVVLTDRVDVYMKTSNGYDNRFVSMYVTLAIDEAEELNYFNVGYTFNQAEYDALTSDDDKIAYLEKCEAEPFKYFDGYYVLAKDIDATGLKFSHEAAIETPTQKIKYNNGTKDTDYTFTKGDVGFLVNEATNTLEPRHKNAPIVGPNGREYMIPRDGYPIAGAYTGVTDAAAPSGQTGTVTVYSGSFGVPAINFKKIGFMGTFDGQGHIISNLNTSRYVIADVKYYNNNEDVDAQAVASKKGAGLFGIINNGCKVQNVAFTGVEFEWSALLAMYGNTPHSGALNTNGVQDILTTDKYQLENVYISAAKDTGKVLSFTCASNGAMLGSFKDVIVDMTGATTQYLLNPGHFTQTNSGLYAKMERVYIASTFDVPSKIISRQEGFLHFGASMADLYANTDILDKFAENPYFEVLNRAGQDGVFFKGAYASTFSVSSEGKQVDKITLDKENLAKELIIEDGFGVANDAVVEFSNGDVLEYANGILKVKEGAYAQGDYEATIKVTAKDFDGNPITLTKTIKVILAPDVVAGGYLQTIDGELVGYKPESIDGLTFSIDEVDLPATLDGGKVKLDLTNVDLSSVKDLESVDVYVDNANGDDLILRVQKLLLAIDEATDLTRFNVGYTYDQAEFDALTSDDDKKAYLENAQANPYDYYEGSVILTKDIDATGITFDHEAIFYVQDNTNVGFIADELTNSLTAVNANAPIVFDGVTYNIPRAGYPAFKKVSTSNTASMHIPGTFFYKAGFYGTFNGHGYTISNLAPARNTTINYYVGETETEFTGLGAGIFGVINANSVVKNVVLKNYDGSKGSAFALVDVSPTKLGTATHNYDENDVFASMGKADRTLFENIYAEVVNVASGTMYRYSNTNRGASFNYVYIDALQAPSMASPYGGATEQALIGGGYPYSTTNGSLCHYVKNTYVLTTRTPNYKSSSYTHLDIVYAKSLTELFSATTNTIGKDKAIMGDVFADNPMYDVVVRGENKGVYLKGSYNADSYEVSFKFVDADGDEISKIAIAPGTTEAEVAIVDLFGNVPASDVKVEFVGNAGDYIDYADGKITVKDHDAATYEVSFTTTVKVGDDETEYTKVLSVQLLPQTVEGGYLQQDGEVYNHGLTSIDGAKFSIDDVEVPATLTSGKLVLDLANVDLSSVKDKDIVNVYMDNTSSPDVNFALTYVLAIIDEASDLTKFNVGYTYDQAEFDALTSDTDKKAYLEKAQANPYDYYEGTILLVKDIDATGITFNHEAIFNVNDNTNVGFTINEIGNTLTAVNANAPIVFDGVTYNFPRPGYPALKQQSTSNTAKTFVPGAYFYKMGYYGTFDGQGYTISNLAPARNTTVQYYVGETATNYTGFGAGIFGTVSANSVIKNVAITNYDGEKGPVFALVDVSPTGKGTDAAYKYDENDVFEAMGKSTRTLFENIYVENTGYSATATMFRYSAGNRGAKLNNIYIDALDVTAKQSAYGGYSEQALITGGMTFSQGNSSFRHNITNVYVLTDMEPGLINTSYTHLDIVYAKSLTELFSATTTTTGKTKDIMGVAFADNEYFDVVSRGTGKGVYWHGTYTETEYEGTLSFVDGEGNPLDSVVIKYGETESDLLVKDLFGTASASDITATVDTNGADVIKYEDGKVKVVNYSAGYYELTLKVTVTVGETSKDYSKTVSVQLLPESKTAYLSQVDGEIVGLDLETAEIEALNGAVATVNSSNTSSLKVEGGKLYLDMATAGLETGVLAAPSEVVVYADSTKDYSLVLTYVTLAIDETSDLTAFNVGYTYDQAEFDALGSDDDKKAYLENAQANPYDYYEGYYVLTNDIDATGFKTVHEAVYATATSGNIGFSVDETTDTITAVNANAAIVFDGTTYNIPRAEYPIMSTTASVPNLTRFIKAGFRGTFDGQGHVISNFNTSRGTLEGAFTYYVDDVLNTASSTQIMGAGIFGMLTGNATVKNVAIDGANVDFGSVFSMYLLEPNTSSMTDADKLIYTGNKRAVFENIYIRTTNSRNWGVITYKYAGVGPQYNNCFFDFTSLGTAANGWKGETVLGHGQVSQGNSGLQVRATNLYVAINTAGTHNIGAANANMDLTMADTVDALYAATANKHGTAKTMAGSFTDNEYFKVVGTAVYWHSLVPSV